ncbi:hypothetical protein EG329_001877 [Mollisiaceae sp. DMI_Dod_QoI]|nr:hypothetical protein EG329_001877 [Helotiales sp. DMI_Dod_QoI]
MDAGAIIVGKAKLQAMIMREEPLECVEFTAPFNPCGDGCHGSQVPSGSSHGSAAAIGSDDWLDFFIGSDTNGTGRKPAHYNGCFSIRPSTGIMNTKGVIGQFACMPPRLGERRINANFSRRIVILYPSDYLPTVNPAQTALIDKYVKSLEAALQVSRTHISLADLWKEQCPDGPENATLQNILSSYTGGYPYNRDAYYDFEGFRNNYTKKYGKPPFTHRAMQWQWNVAKTISATERDFYWRRSELYRHWLLEKDFEADNKECITIMIFPIEVGKPSYRDVELPPYYILSGYASLHMSPMMRAPELTAIG